MAHRLQFINPWSNLDTTDIIDTSSLRETVLYTVGHLATFFVPTHNVPTALFPVVTIKVVSGH